MKKEHSKLIFIFLILSLVLIFINSLRNENKIDGNSIFNTIKNLFIEPIAQEVNKEPVDIKLKENSYFNPNIECKNCENADKALFIAGNKDQISKIVGLDGDKSLISSLSFGDSSDRKIIINDNLNKKQIFSNYNKPDDLKNENEITRELTINIIPKDNFEGYYYGGLGLFNSSGDLITSFWYENQIDNYTNRTITLTAEVPFSEDVYLIGFSRSFNFELNHYYDIYYNHLIKSSQNEIYLIDDEAKNVITNSDSIAININKNARKERLNSDIYILLPNFPEPIKFALGAVGFTFTENPVYVSGDLYTRLYYNEDYFLGEEISKGVLTFNHLFERPQDISLTHYFDQSNLRTTTVNVGNSFNYPPTYSTIFTGFSNFNSNFELIFTTVYSIGVPMPQGTPFEYDIVYDKSEKPNVLGISYAYFYKPEISKFGNSEKFMYGKWFEDIYPGFGGNKIEFYKAPISPRIYSLGSAVMGLDLDSSNYPKIFNYYFFGFIFPGVIGGTTSVRLPDGQLLSSDGGPILDCYFPEYSNPPLPNPCPIGRYRITWDQSNFLIGNNNLINKDLCYDGNIFNECAIIRKDY